MATSKIVFIDFIGWFKSFLKADSKVRHLGINVCTYFQIDHAACMYIHICRQVGTWQQKSCWPRNYFIALSCRLLFLEFPTDWRKVWQILEPSSLRVKTFSYNSLPFRFDWRENFRRSFHRWRKKLPILFFLTGFEICFGIGFQSDRICGKKYIQTRCKLR
jgi:hypothetical protein